MTFSSNAVTHLINLYTFFDSALPAQTVGFVALGALITVTVIAIALLLFADASHARGAR